MNSSVPFDTGTDAADSLRNGTGNWPSMPKPCPWCSGPWNQVYHSGVCPRVRAIEYYPNGMIKRVEFRSMSDLPCLMLHQRQVMGMIAAGLGNEQIAH